jgi:hypothetical protein
MVVRHAPEESEVYRIKGIWAVVAGVLWLLIVSVPGFFTSPTRYEAYATGVQAVGLVLALLLAAWTLDVGATTLRTDVKDRRVDRTLALHEELTSGETDKSRRRLLVHLRDHAPVGEKYLAITRQELGAMAIHSRYSSAAPPEATPFSDAGVLLRFFERAQLAQQAHTIEPSMFVELIGRHATWWNALFKQENTNPRQALKALSDWSDDFAKTHRDKYSYLTSWGQSRLRDFPVKDD